MITELTEYLFKYKAVTIPGIGTVMIQHTAPVLEKTEATCLAPAYSLQLAKEDAVSAHQQQALGAGLIAFGRQLTDHLNSQSFVWQGIGTLSRRQQEIVLNAENIEVPYLQNLTAEPMLRQDAAHTVRVGEQEFTSTQMTETLALPQEKRSFLLIGWLVLGLAVAVAAFLLYKGHFTPAGVGLQYFLD